VEWVWRLIERDCTGCGICADVCPHGAIRMTPEMAYPEPIEPRCVGCMECVEQCPFDAVRVEEATAASVLSKSHAKQS
jgi:ferredoxin